MQHSWVRTIQNYIQFLVKQSKMNAYHYSMKSNRGPILCQEWELGNGGSKEEDRTIGTNNESMKRQNKDI